MITVSTSNLKSDVNLKKSKIEEPNQNKKLIPTINKQPEQTNTRKVSAPNHRNDLSVNRVIKEVKEQIKPISTSNSKDNLRCRESRNRRLPTEIENKATTLPMIKTTNKKENKMIILSNEPPKLSKLNNRYVQHCPMSYEN
jgi:hypothetical protein